MFAVLFIIPSARSQGLAVALGGLFLAGAGYFFLRNEKLTLTENCNNQVKIPDYSRIYGEILGQPIALSLVPPMFQRHVSDPNPPRAIVYYFIGWSGTGKNHFTKLLLNKIYPEFERNGKSELVTTFTGTHYTGNFNKYRQGISNIINKKLKDCPRSTFIFDQVEHFPPGFFDFLSDFLNSSERNGIQYNMAIFILLGYVFLLFSIFQNSTFFKIFYAMFQELKWSRNSRYFL